MAYGKARCRDIACRAVAVHCFFSSSFVSLVLSVLSFSHSLKNANGVAESPQHQGIMASLTFISSETKEFLSDLDQENKGLKNPFRSRFGWYGIELSVHRWLFKKVGKRGCSHSSPLLEFKKKVSLFTVDSGKCEMMVDALCGETSFAGNEMQITKESFP